ncbi:feruloyl-CoA synthase [Tropicibacter naphthalenivorans]|uniref:Long-chain-fatty-acid--CoA ligase n=1 Tax=Tropicibacter naphthalenivorans TaxID=441103 RepID=A0A0P1GYK3_9RHOB|nr:feruloyl-CoA synthase [Tropicibacter naphthalenivorans]CUH82066.1 Long-chain-fatty-acid--CoA ligase [Tropicibacter naphthalenivorans]SMD08391.1 feruloyl-CoA synthase [Tropicibacter naphthalenivorans]
MSKYRPHAVAREDRDDGTIILRSAYDISPVASKSGDWVDAWAEKTPDAVFIAERSGKGWREVSYAETREQVRTIAAALLARGMGPNTPIMVISGNSVDHGLLALAAQYIGVPTVPLAEQYALIPGARPQLIHCAEVIKPAMVYADDGAKFADGLALELFDGVEKLVSINVAEGQTPFAELLRGDGADVDTAAAKVTPDTVAKYLMTSGSTSHPKAVITTQGMMCANQAQILDALPFLGAKPPKVMDWLPWNHVFGGSHNFNMMLSNGGSFYIDGGKPIPAMIGTTLENNREHSATLAFNVPVGFAYLRDAMKTDKALRESYFRDLDMLFYAGASLPQDVWRDLEDMARDVRGDVPLMNSSWGLTETAPACLIQHEPTTMSGIVGVPMTGVEVKMIPDEDMRCEVRVRGPNIMPGYLNDPEKTADAFDEEGFFVTGDAMKFVDPDDLTKGLRFDGRISEDFKLLSGTWVRAANLRLEVIPELAPLAADVVICGADKSEIGVLIFPTAEAMGMGEAQNGALVSDALKKAIGGRLEARSGHGSAARIARAMVLAEPPSIGDGEITAKGNLNFRKVLARRADLYQRLYDDADPAVILGEHA